MASTSGSKIPESAVQPPPTARECESCHTAPGIPFCRVEWSFLCTGCAAVVHGHNCVVPVPPNANPNANFPHLPFYPYPYLYPYANPSSEHNAAVHLSSEDDDLSPAHPDGQGKFWRQIPGRAMPYRRLESVMRYREKKKSRRFEKKVRYENRRAYAELRPRLEGKFARLKDDEEKEEAGPPDSEVGDDRGARARLNPGKEATPLGHMGLDQVSARPDTGADLEEMVAGGVELEQHDFTDEARFR